MKDKKWIWVIGFLTITGMIGKRFLKKMKEKVDE